MFRWYTSWLHMRMGGALGVQHHQLPLLQMLPHHELRQQGDDLTLQQEPGDDIGAAHLPEGAQLPPLFRQELLHGVPVADALLRQVQGFLQQALQGDGFHPCQGGGGGSHKVDGFWPLGHLHPLGVIELLV